MADSACIPKNRSHHFAGRFHGLRLLQSQFAFENPLFWLFLCLGSVVMYLCFVHSYVSTQKLVGIATEKRQNNLSRPNDCVYSALRENAAPILPRFFSHPIFGAKWKTLYFTVCLLPQLFRTLWFVDHSKLYPNHFDTTSTIFWDSLRTYGTTLVL